MARSLSIRKDLILCPTALRRARSKFPVPAFRLSFWLTGKRRGAIPRSQLSFRQTFRHLAGLVLALNFLLRQSISKPHKKLGGNWKAKLNRGAIGCNPQALITFPPKQDLAKPISLAA